MICGERATGAVLRSCMPTPLSVASVASTSHCRHDRTVEFRRGGRCKLSRRRSVGFCNRLNNLPMDRSRRVASAVWSSSSSSSIFVYFAHIKKTNKIDSE